MSKKNEERIQTQGHRIRAAWFAGLVLVTSYAQGIFATPTPDQGLADLSLEQLANLPITSVSKKPEPLADAAASVYVITNEDIKRSGARTLMEALRLAPNLQVAQATADSWAITARGSNATYADKLLVLIDGRIVYSPMFSGTFWEVQNVVLEDVDRIEVVSGPGGTLWGTNAVNGVINIITKRSQYTQSTLASAGGGHYGADGAVRYGGNLSNGGSYRVYGMYKDTYASSTSAGVPQSDGVDVAQMGFRSDWDASDHQFTLQGDAYGANEDQDLPGGRARASGVNLLSHWDDQLASGGDVSLLAYYDRVKRFQPNDFDDSLDIADIEFQHTLPSIGAQSFIWGASYRFARDQVQNHPGWNLIFYPAEANQSWVSLFGQDEARLSPDWRLIMGLRAERNPYSGTELLPNLRLAWNVASDSLLWAAVSRAARSPSRLDTSWYSPAQPPYLLVGNSDFESETVKVYEMGFRTDAGGNWSYSASVYHNDYDHVRTTTVVSLAPFQLTLGNGMTTTETGLETWATYKPVPNWRLQAGLNVMRESHTLAFLSAPSSIPSEGDDAHNWWSLRSSYDFAGGEQLDVTVRHAGALPDPPIPAYTTADVRFGWSLGSHLECSVLALNLFGPRHEEFNPQAPITEFGRGLYVKLVWHP
ncbi:MAG: TonB-dependent receptor plug domain-containing protein [Gammaproteobacteria bacterium]